MKGPWKSVRNQPCTCAAWKTVSTWSLQACLEDRRLREAWIWTAIKACDKKSSLMMECVTWHEVCSLYSCCRYAMIFNSAFSLLEQYSRSSFLKVWAPQQTGWPSFLWPSCLLCCLSSNEVEVLNCWYALNVYMRDLNTWRLVTVKLLWLLSIHKWSNNTFVH